MPRLLHTADWHLGKQYKNESVVEQQSQLSSARFEAIDNLIALAREQNVDAVLVAGDLFDGPCGREMKENVIPQACQRLAQFKVPVFVISGNHDALEKEGSPFRHMLWHQHKPANVTLFTTPGFAYLESCGVAVLAAPVQHHREPTDTSAALTRAMGSELPQGTLRVGLAHGPSSGFGVDSGDLAVIDPTRAQTSGLDYLALGDWHGTLQVGPATWYSGAPEPTNFANNDQGNALVVDLQLGQPPKVQTHRTRHLNWLRIDRDLATEADMTAVLEALAAVDRPHRTRLRIELRGGISALEHDRLHVALANAGFMHVRKKFEALHMLPDRDHWEARVRPEGHLAGLWKTLVTESETDPVARRAMEWLVRLSKNDGSDHVD